MVFADGKPLDDITDALQQVVDDVQEDPELKNFYSDATGFLKRALTDKDFITSDAADAEAHELYDRSQELLHEKEGKYGSDMERLFDEIKSFRDAITYDAENRRVIETSKKVFNDIVILDKNGSFRGVRRKVVRDIFDVMLPRFVGEVRYIPMPRIEYQDRDYDLILENVILESGMLLVHSLIPTTQLTILPQSTLSHIAHFSKLSPKQSSQTNTPSIPATPLPPASILRTSISFSKMPPSSSARKPASSLSPTAASSTYSWMAAAPPPRSSSIL